MTRITRTDPSATTSDVSAMGFTAPRFLLWSGSSWPARPADTRATFFIGGAAATNAPVDINIVNGDVWIPQDGSTGITGTSINVRDYGAVGDGVTDDTSAFTNALAAAAAGTISGATAVVMVPAGRYLTGPLTLGNRVTIRGVGVGATKLILKTGSTAPIIKNATHARMCGVHDIFLDGNNSVVSSTSAHGLVFDNSAALDTDPANGIAEYVDGRHFASNVYIQSTKGSGFIQTGRGACLFMNISCFVCDGHGFEVGTDSWYANCDTGSSGKDGFIIRSGSNRLANCKAWYSGRITTAGETDGVGNGFHAANGLFSMNQYTTCSAQDNARAGFYMKNVGRQVWTSCEADSNNTANLGHAGVEIINSYVNHWHGMSWERNANATHQLAALRINGGSQNRADVIVDNIAGMAQGSLTTDSDMVTGQHYVSITDDVQNRVWVPGSTYHSVFTSAATGTVTLTNNGLYHVFTGSTATWTLPPLAGNTGLEKVIKNRGSGTLTVQRTGSDQIYTTSAVTSTTIVAGASGRFVNDGVFWLAL